MLWNRAMDGSVTGVNLIAAAEKKKGVWWSKLNNATNENHNAWVLFFLKKAYEIKQIALFSLPPFRNESGASATQSQIQTHLSKDPLLNWRCQHLISHTLAAIPRGTIIQNKESQASSFLRDPLFSCPFSSFKIPRPNITSTCVLLCEQHPSQTPSVSMCISHIAYLR